MISPKFSKWLYSKVIDYEEDFFLYFCVPTTRDNNIPSFFEEIDRQQNELMLLKFTHIFVSCLPSLLFWCGCYRVWWSHDYRGMREMMVKVKSKLTGIETTGYSYDHCTLLHYGLVERVFKFSFLASPLS